MIRKGQDRNIGGIDIRAQAQFVAGLFPSALRTCGTGSHHHDRLVCGRAYDDPGLVAYAATKGAVFVQRFRARQRMEGLRPVQGGMVGSMLVPGVFIRPSGSRGQGDRAGVSGRFVKDRRPIATDWARLPRRFAARDDSRWMPYIAVHPTCAATATLINSQPVQRSWLSDQWLPKLGPTETP